MLKLKEYQKSIETKLTTVDHYLKEKDLLIKELMENKSELGTIKGKYEVFYYNIRG